MIYKGSICDGVGVGVGVGVIQRVFKNQMQKKMERWGSWLWFNLRSSFLFHAKIMFLKAGSCLKHKAKENREGLVSLYRDLEICGGEYRDIRVMWEIIQSSRPPNCPEAAVTRRQWRFCFRPN